jgi:hypothetical protein
MQGFFRPASATNRIHGARNLGSVGAEQVSK